MIYDDKMRVKRRSLLLLDEPERALSQESPVFIGAVLEDVAR